MWRCHRPNKLFRGQTGYYGMGYTAVMEGSARSKVTEKYQATIPAPIRKVLGVKKGDTVIFEVVGGQVVLRRMPPLDRDYLGALTATLGEWNSKEDDDAYGGL